MVFENFIELYNIIWAYPSSCYPEFSPWWLSFQPHPFHFWVLWGPLLLSTCGCMWGHILEHGLSTLPPPVTSTVNKYLARGGTSRHLVDSGIFTNWILSRCCVDNCGCVEFLSRTAGSEETQSAWSSPTSDSYRLSVTCFTTSRKLVE